jgi:N-acetylmuramoyl-L-alanine amidase
MKKEIVVSMFLLITTVTLAKISMPADIVVTGLNSSMTILDTIEPKVTVMPAGGSQDVIWETSDKNTVTINNGMITATGTGTALIKVASTVMPELYKTFFVTVTLDPIKIIDFLHVEHPLHGTIITYGVYKNIPHTITGSVINYLFDNVHIHTETMIPLDARKSPYIGQVADNRERLLAIEARERIARTGMFHPALKYIVYHDTENNNPGAGALMHARYMNSSDNINWRARSWHYTVDDHAIYQTIPDNEVAWQGDSYEAYANSIGIETCVNQGSDLYMTWQRAGKLMASLLIKYGLSIDQVKQHNQMMSSNAKDCPKTLRNAGLWDMAVHIIYCEYLVAKELKDYRIVFVSESPEFVDNKGRIITLPQKDTAVRYTVTLSGPHNYTEQRTYTSIIPAASTLRIIPGNSWRR